MDKITAMVNRCMESMIDQDMANFRSDIRKIRADNRAARNKIKEMVE